MNKNEIRTIDRCIGRLELLADYFGDDAWTGNVIGRILTDLEALASMIDETLPCDVLWMEAPEAAETLQPEPKPEPKAEPKPETKPKQPQKPMRVRNRHEWTDEEDEWIEQHLNSATSRDVADKFGVSAKAAYLHMLKVKDKTEVKE